jgi:hypothetical protein
MTDLWILFSGRVDRRNRNPVQYSEDFYRSYSPAHCREFSTPLPSPSEFHLKRFAGECSRTRYFRMDGCEE